MTSRLPPDFHDLLVSLRDHGVEHLVVGAHALAASGVVRATQDLDVLVRASPENAARLVEALREFGAPLAAHGVSAEDFAREGIVYQMGLPPSRIDLLTRISGVTFEEAWAGHRDLAVDDLTVPVLGPVELVRNKRASGRTKDLLDIELLREAGFDPPGE